MRHFEFKQLNEAQLNAKSLVKEPGRLDSFLDIVKQGGSTTRTKDGVRFTVDKNYYSNQGNLNALRAEIEAQANKTPQGAFNLVGSFEGGEVETVKSNQLEKFKGAGTRASSEEDISNAGEIAEVLHAAAVYARLINGTKDITPDDLQNILTKLQNKVRIQQDKKEVNSKQFDSFAIEMNMNSDVYSDIKKPDIVNHPKLKNLIANAIVPDANDNTGEYANRYATNNEFDSVEIVGDGISDQTGTKADIEFRNKVTGKVAKFSLKANTTRELHQVGGGAVTLPLIERYEILREFFEEMGIDVADARSDFENAKDIFNGYILAYKEAVRKAQESFQGEFDEPEKKFLSNLLTTLKTYAVKKEDGMDVKQFTTKGYFVLDVNKLDDLSTDSDFNLEVKYDEGTSKVFPEIKLPKIKFVTREGQEFLTIRMYVQKSDQGPYIRNKVDKGPAFVLLTTKKTNIKGLKK